MGAVMFFIALLFAAESSSAQELQGWTSDREKLFVTRNGGFYGVKSASGTRIVPENYAFVLPVLSKDWADDPGRIVFVLAFKKGIIHEVIYEGEKGETDSIAFRFAYTIYPQMLADVYDAKGNSILRNCTDVRSFFFVSLDSKSSTPHFIYENSLGEEISYPNLKEKVALNYLHPGSMIQLTDSAGQLYLYDLKKPGTLHGPFLEIHDQGCGFRVLKSEKGWGIFEDGYGMVLSPVYEDLQFNCSPEITYNRIFPFMKNGKWGLLGEKDKVLQKPIFDRITPVPEYGFILEKGKGWEKRNARDTIRYFDEFTLEERLEIVQNNDSVLVNGKSGFCNGLGKMVVPAKHSAILVFENALIAADGTRTGEKLAALRPDDVFFSMGYLSSNYSAYLKRNFISQPTFTAYTFDGKKVASGIDSLIYHSFFPGSDEDFPEMFMSVRKSGKWGMIGPISDLIVRMEYDHLEPAILGQEQEIPIRIIANKKDKWKLLDDLGKPLNSIDYSSLRFVPVFDAQGKLQMRFIASVGGEFRLVRYEQSDLYGMVETIEENRLVGAKYMLLDADANRISGELCDSVYELSQSGMFFFVRHFKTGLMNYKGEVLLPAVYNRIDFLGDELFELTESGLSGLFYKGEFVLPMDYSGFDWLSDDLIKLRLEDKFGLFSLSKRKVLIAPEYDFIYDQGSSLLIIGLNQLSGIADSTGTILLPAEYDDIDLEPEGFSPGIARVTSEGKAGYFDLEKREWSSKPQFDLVGNYPENGKFLRVNCGGVPEINADGSVDHIAGGKWGILNKRGILIVPPVYKAVSVFAEDIGLFRCETENSVDYFNEKGEKIANGNSIWMKSISYRLKVKNENPVYSFNLLNGPTGADATAFYCDKKGNYWLGTGSSGGVYFSSDKGLNWTAANQGIGPVHVVLLFGRRDTLYSVITESGEYFDGENPAMISRVIYRMESDKSWNYLFPEKNEESKSQEIVFSDHLIRDYLSAGLPGLWFMETDHFFSGAEQLATRYSAMQTKGWLSENKQDTLYKNWPYDLMLRIGGNIHFAGDDTLLLAVSGLYRVNNKTVVPVSEKGLIASDITQMEWSPDGSLIIREGEHDIWRYRNGSFVKLIDNYNWNLTRPKNLTRRNTGRFSIDKNGLVYVVVADQLVQIAADNTVSILAGSAMMHELFNNDSYYYNVLARPLFAFIDSKDELVAAFELVSEGEVIPMIYFGVCQKGKKDFLFSDQMKIERSCDELGLHQMGIAKYLMSCYNLFGTTESDSLSLPVEETNYFDGLSPGKIAVAPDGTIAVLLDDRTLAFRDPGTRLWQRFYFEGMRLNTIGFDHQGQLYAAAGFRYMFYCDGAAEQLQSAGLYRFIPGSNGAEWKKIENPVNPKILSITTWPGKGLLLGTSGSGLVGVSITK